jgi:hypothetical protein
LGTHVLETLFRFAEPVLQSFRDKNLDSMAPVKSPLEKIDSVSVRYGNCDGLHEGLEVVESGNGITASHCTLAREAAGE